MVREPTMGGCPDGRKDGTPEQPGDGGDALGSARQSPKLKLLIKKIIMNKFKTIGILLLSFIIIASSCKQDKIAKKESSTKKEAKKKSVKIPVFNGDSAFAFVKKQVDFGPRVTGSEAHKKAQQWFIDKFKSYGAEVEIQKFKAKFPNGVTADAANIIAHFNPDKKKKLIIASHYDSRYMAEKDPDPELKNKPIDGADDGASGVGVIFELARILKENPLNMAVDLILFDAEDNGNDKDDATWCLGSQYWSKKVAQSGYKADFGILLDMVGAKNALFPKEYNSKRYAGPVQDVIWNLAYNMGYGDLFANIERGNINDDHYYVNKDAKIPMVDIINIPDAQKGFGAYHHTHKDNIDIIDKNTLRRTGQVVIAVMYKYASDDL